MAASPILSKYLPLWAGILSIAVGIAAYQLGNTYVPRMSSHSGYYLVAVDDRVEAAGFERPRHAILVVIDGLRRDSAQAMKSLARVRQAGQCRIMNTGPLTVSRPVFSIMSTGLESHRTGARNNRDTSALAAESVWQAAREAGRVVAATGGDPWWRQLFPNGFDHYYERPDPATDLFAETELFDVNLIHPPYVDTAGHKHGADSPEYRAAVARVDGELDRFLDRLDLDRDLIVVTADHGHTAAGGHGGPQPEIADVLTCYAGPGVQRDQSDQPAAGRMEARTLGPSFAVLIGVRFPRTMSAGDDDLDTIWSIAAPEALGEGYRGDRQQAIARFREANRAQLASWLEADPDDEGATWGQLYERERRGQLVLLAIALALILAGLALSMRLRKLSLKQALGLIAWMAAAVTATFLAWTIIRGSFDFTSINERAPYIKASLAICLAGAALAAIVHGAIWRDSSRYFGDQLTLMLVALAIDAAHPLIYGAPLGFPLPSRIELFLPFIASSLALAHAIWTVVACLVIGALRRRRYPATQR